MQGDPYKRLGWWWNRQLGTMTRRDVWLEHRMDRGNFRLRWRVGQYPETEELFLDVAPTMEFLRRLVGRRSADGWQETWYLDADGTLWDHTRPTDPDKAIRPYFVYDEDTAAVLEMALDEERY